MTVHYHLLCDPKEFLLTRPSRDVTSDEFACGIRNRFLLTRPSRDVTLLSAVKIDGAPISTHTPLAGRDLPVAGGPLTL